MQTQLQRIARRAEASGRSRPGRLQDQPRHAQHPGLGAADLATGCGWCKDPTVQVFAPKLLRALDRAVSYSEGVLAYGRTQEPAPVRRRLRLRQLVDEVQGMLGLDASTGIEFENLVDAGFEVDADSEQLFRVLTNLVPQRHPGDVGRQRERAGAPPHHIGRAHRQPSARSSSPTPVPACRRRRARTCSRRSAARPAAAAPGLASPSPTSWCAPMAAPSGWSRASAAARSFRSPSPTARSGSTKCARACAARPEARAA